MACCSMVAVAREEGFESVFVPSCDAGEAALVEGIRVFPVETLGHLSTTPSE